MPFCAVAEDKDVERMARKFKLDDHVTSRLMELKAPGSGQINELNGPWLQELCDAMLNIARG